MKRLLVLLSVLPLLMVACKKDKNEKSNGSIANYYIKGKMKNLVQGDNGTEWPFVMTFGADGKAQLVNLTGVHSLYYSVSNDKITLNDIGDFNLQDKQITDWTIASMNITSATLLPVGANQLRGKSFEGPVKYSKLQFDATLSVYFDPGNNSVLFDKTPGAQVYSFQPYAGVAVYIIYDAPSNSGLFMMYDDGKLAISNNTEVAGFVNGQISAK